MSSSSQNSIFRQQQLLYRSSHYLVKDKQPTLYKPPSPDAQSSKGRKRRISEDEEMGMVETPIDPPSNNINTATINNIEKKIEFESIHNIKRNRTSIQKQYPITKLLATLDKDRLIELINDLVDANPHLLPEVDAHLPQPKES